MTIKLLPRTGSFAENKDIARDIRLNQILPALERGKTITLDFHGIEGITQSFVHALISDLFRTYGEKVLDSLRFKNCNETLQQVITIVTEYMQEAN